MPPLQLEIEGGGAQFRFLVPGAFEPRLEPVWKDAAEPPEVTEIREVWEFPGARLVSPDGTSGAFWRRWTALLLKLQVRGPGYPLWVRLIRDPAGAAEVVWTLGPPTHEKFKIEALSAGTDELVPSATWRVLAPVTLVVSAVQRFADANGIVGWSQETSSRYDPGGLQVLEWQTHVTTKEGVSAVEKARAFARIDVRPFGSRYTYETNGPHGVEVTTPDADEPNQRVPTRASAVSRIRQWGIGVGTTAPGTSPTEVGYSVRVRIADDERRTTYRATARGPRAREWVLKKEPVGPISESEVYFEEALREAEGTWVVKEPKQPEQEGTLAGSEIKTEVSGGHEAFDYEPAVGHEPVFFLGARLPYRLSVQVKVRRRGGEGRAVDLMLPGVLPAPWRLDRNNSTETEPVVEEEGSDAASRRWAREAKLLYYSAQRPTRSPLAQLKQVAPVASYYLGRAS